MSEMINYKKEAEKLARALDNLIGMIEPRVDNTTAIDGKIFETAYETLRASKVFKKLPLPDLTLLEPRWSENGDSVTYAWVAKGCHSLDTLAKAARMQYDAELYEFSNGPGRKFSHGPRCYTRGSRTLMTYTVAMDI